MTFTDSFKNGFEVLNKNWAVVAIQIAAIFVAMMGFVILIAIPLVLAAVVFGSDLMQIVNNFSLESLTSLITAKHLSIAIVIALVLTVYILAMVLILVFIYGGSCGVLAKSVQERKYGFTLKGFYVEGKRMFFPLLGFNIVIGFITAIEFAVLAVCYFLMLSLRDTVNAGNGQLANFIEIFSALITLTVLFFLLTGTLSVNVYGTSILTLRGGGVFRALRGSVSFIINKPSAYWFYLVCIAGFIGINIALLIIGAIISVIPFIGAVLAIPFQLLLQVAQSYMGFLVISSVFSYYHGVTGGESISPSDILAEALQPGGPPPD
ncbi:MAG: hypothetical protein HQL05_15165 [Nitrospirae bacterium]|nr:hypothetical protein [Nitrospirota bacterium]